MIKAVFDGQHLSFAQPYYFLFLLLLPVLIWWQIKRKSAQQPHFRLTSLESVKGLKPTWRVRLRPILLVLRSIAFVALVSQPIA